MLVAPQVPSGPVSERCIALRATWPRAATMVKGIQSVATESMGDPAERAATVPGGANAVNRQDRMRLIQIQCRPRESRDDSEFEAAAPHQLTSSLRRSPC